MRLEKKIIDAIKKFNLNLKGINVLTEAATGNYVVTPVIAAVAGANVFAFTKDSKYGDTDEVNFQTINLSKSLIVEKQIKIITNFDEVDLSQINILTNTGFLRPINKSLIDKLNKNCVIPLMWEPWEFRPEEIDIEACYEKGIKVYGTNEADSRLKTMYYLGYIVLYFLLSEKRSPFSSKVVLLADDKFGNPIANVLRQNQYEFEWISDYKSGKKFSSDFDVIICAEHSNNECLIGNDGFITTELINHDTLIIHISGFVAITDICCKKIPENPSKFGKMSFTADFVDSTAVIDLHTAGLKVAEGMLYAKGLGLEGINFKHFLEANYSALAFGDPKFW